MIVAMDPRVPVVDEGMVHLFDRAERSIAEFDDVGMAKVGVTRVIVRYPFTPHAI